MKILCVDDDPAILAVLDVSLGTLGSHDVKTALSGDAALSEHISSDADFDVFVLDIQMPGMSGIELCAEIRQRPKYDNIPILMLTAMSDGEYIEQAFMNGATDYLTKPFDPTELNLRVELLVKKAHAEHAANPTPENDDAEGQDSAAQDSAATDVASESEPASPDQPSAIVYSEPEHDKRSESEERIDALIVSGLEAGKQEPAKEPASRGPRTIVLDAPLNLQNQQRMLSKANFESFIDRMNAASRKEVQLFGVGITNIKDLHRDHHDSAFTQILTDLTAVLGEALSKHSYLMAYFGNGVFCGSTRSENIDFIHRMPQTILNAIESSELSSAILKNAELEIVLGPISGPSMFKSLASRLEKVRAATEVKILETQ